MDKAPGAKLETDDGEVHVYIRGAVGVSAVAPQETQHPVRLEYWSAGVCIGSADFGGISALFAGQPLPRDAVIRRTRGGIGAAVRQALRRALPTRTEQERAEVFRQFQGHHATVDRFIRSTAHEHLPPGFGWLLDPWKTDDLRARIEATMRATLWSCPADDGGVFGFIVGQL